METKKPPVTDDNIPLVQIIDSKRSHTVLSLDEFALLDEVSCVGRESSHRTDVRTLAVRVNNIWTGTNVKDYFLYVGWEDSTHIPYLFKDAEGAYCLGFRKAG
jgi:hypothetical protein